MSRLTATALAAAVAGPLFALACSAQNSTPLSAPVTVEARDIKPTPLLRVLPSPSAARASRSRRVAPAAPMDDDDGGLTTVLLRIRSCESGPNGYATHGWAFDADYYATNPRSTASGAWQVLRGTWDHYRGYATAQDAPPSVQDAFALDLYAARGTSPWVSSRSCWGRS